MKWGSHPTDPQALRAQRATDGAYNRVPAWGRSHRVATRRPAARQGRQARDPLLAQNEGTRGGLVGLAPPPSGVGFIILIV